MHFVPCRALNESDSFVEAQLVDSRTRIETTFGTEQCNGRSLRGNDWDSVRYRGLSEAIVIGDQSLEVITQIESGSEMNRVE